MSSKTVSLVVFIFLVYTLKALSVCDDIDITFIIDQDTIKYDLEGAATFIDSIIEHGSSEYSAFSVQIYGENINYKQDMASLRVDLVDTYGKHRRHKSEHMTSHLMGIFNNITVDNAVNAYDLPSVSSESLSSVNISLQDAFLAAVAQDQPSRPHKKRARFSTSRYAKHKIGGEDDHNRYFIFDHFNKLITDNTNNICALFEYIDGKDDESIHFVMGQKFENIGETFKHLCPDKQHLLHRNLFFYFDSVAFDAEYEEYEDESDSDDSEEDQFYKFYDEKVKYDNVISNMDQIHHITCPTYMEHPQYDGHLRLSPHSQWIDPNTIKKCKIKYDTRHDRQAQHLTSELDSTHSYIIVDDHHFDDNTFHTGDFLMAEPVVYDYIQTIGCLEPIYQIVGIKHIKKVSDHHNVLKLYVRLPQSVTDYMTETDLVLVNVERHPHASENSNSNSNSNSKAQATPSPTVLSTRRLLEPPSDDKKAKKGITFAEDVDLHDPSQGDIAEQMMLHTKKRGKSFSDHIKKWGSHVHTRSKSLGKKLISLLSKRSITLPEFERVESDMSALSDPESDEGFEMQAEFAKVLKDLKYRANPAKYRFNELSKPVASINGLGKEGTDLSKEDKLVVRDAGRADTEQGVFGAEHNVLSKTVKLGNWDEEESKHTFKLGKKEYVLVPDKVFVTAAAEGKLKYNLEVKVSLDFQGRFRWLGLFVPKAKVNIRFQLVGTLEAEAKFYFEATGSLGIRFELPIEITTLLVMAGPVPIIIKPYVLVGAGISTHDLTVVVDFAAQYKEQIIVGYRYEGARKDVGRKDQKHIWKIEKRKGWPKIIRKTYDRVNSNSEDAVKYVSPLVDESAIGNNNGFFFERTAKTLPEDIITKKDISIKGGEDDCSARFGFKEIFIEPRVGVQLYAALSFEAGIKGNLPVQLVIKITDAGTEVCGNKKTTVCPLAGPLLKAGPIIDLEFNVVMAAKLKMPAFVWGIKEFFVIGKLAFSIKNDFKEFAKDAVKLETEMAGAKNDMQAILNKIKEAVADLKTGKRKAAIALIPDIVKLINDFKAKFTKTTGLIKKWKARIEKRKTTIEGVKVRLEEIIDNPLAIKQKALTYEFPSFPVIHLMTPKPENCVTIVKIVSELVKNGCCDKPRAARVGFDDWYHGYDSYDSYDAYDAYNEYKNKYNVRGRHSKKQLNAAPLVQSRYNNNQNYLFASAVVLDVILLVILMCMVGCAFVLCGGFVFYNYNKLLQRKDYNILSVNEDNEDEQV